jgi:hypothetical protein
MCCFDAGFPTSWLFKFIFAEISKNMCTGTAWTMNIYITCLKSVVKEKYRNGLQTNPKKHRYNFRQQVATYKSTVELVHHDCLILLFAKVQHLFLLEYIT